MSERFYAPCPRGLEGALAAELDRLAALNIAPDEGGVAFAGPFSLAYQVNLESRIASRVLWEIGRRSYRDEKDIYDLARGIDWPRWFRFNHAIRVDLASAHSPLKSLEFVTLRIKDGVCDRFLAGGPSRPSVNKEQPDVRIRAFLSATEVTLYLDTSGESLFKRGYRRDTGEAPLRENLAAGLLHLAGWKPGTTLLDPMCGSGTIVVEAALIAMDVAPGMKRSFGFEKLSWFDSATWQRILTGARKRVKPSSAAAGIYARDIDAISIQKCRANLAAAGADGAVIVGKGDVLTAPPPTPPGLLVTNPPYGIRLEEAETMALFYPRLGDVFKQKYAGWGAFIFSGDLRLPKLIGLKSSKRTPLYNGAIECRLYEYRMVAGALRPDLPRKPI